MIIFVILVHKGPTFKLMINNHSLLVKHFKLLQFTVFTFYTKYTKCTWLQVVDYGLTD